MNIDGIRQRIKNIEEKLKPGEARIIVNIDGNRQEVSVSEYLDHRFEWKYEDTIVGGENCVPPIYFIWLKLMDDAIAEEQEKGTDPDNPDLIRYIRDRETCLRHMEILGGLACEE